MDLTDSVSSILSNNIIKENLPNIKYSLIQIFAFSQIFLWSKIGSEHKILSVSQQMFYSGIVLLIVGFSLFKQRKAKMVDLGFNRTTAFLILRNYGSGMGNFFALLALKHMRINSASAIFFIFPFVTNILSTFIFGEKYTFKEFLKTVGCFIGAICVTKPFGLTPEDTPLGFFFASMTLICYATTPLVSKLLEGCDFSINLIGFGLTNVFIYYPVMYLAGDTGYPITWQFFPVVIFFCVARISAPIFFDLTFRDGNIVLLTSLEFVILPWTLLYNVFLFQQSSDWLDVFGSFLILFLNFLDVYIVLFRKKNKKKESLVKL